MPQSKVSACSFAPEDKCTWLPVMRTTSVWCRSIVAHMRGKARFDTVPTGTKIAHFDFLPYFAARDPDSFPPGQWRAHYEKLALSWPDDVPLPIP